MYPVPPEAESKLLRCKFKKKNKIINFVIQSVNSLFFFFLLIFHCGNSHKSDFRRKKKKACVTILYYCLFRFDQMQMVR